MERDREAGGGELGSGEVGSRDPGPKGLQPRRFGAGDLGRLDLRPRDVRTGERWTGGVGPGEVLQGDVRPLLLLIDTAGADGSLAFAGELVGSPAVGLAEGRAGSRAGAAAGGERMAEAADWPRVLRSAVLPGRSSSERLFPALRDMLAAEGRALGEVGVIAVVLGPGSFTGIRVGVAAAKGLAEALGVPVIGLSRLAVLASCAAEDPRQGSTKGASGEGAAGRMTAALLDAGRGEFFCGRFREGEDAAVWEGLLTQERVREVCAGDRVVAWEAAVAERLPELSVEVLGGAGAGAALRLAMRRVRAGAWDDVALLDGYYLRRTPAEVALEERAAVTPEAASRRVEA